MSKYKNLKNIIITGASGGIGSEIALTLANANNRLLLVYNKNENSIKDLIPKLAHKCQFEVFKCDLTDIEQIQSMIFKILASYQTIDCLVNCAGISLFEQIQDTTLDSYNNIFDNNLKSVVFMTQCVSKAMIRQQTGKIINISSMWGKVGASMESLYSASKGAINTLTLSLAKELGPSNITVNSVCPGLIDTKMNSNIQSSVIDEIVNETPLQRIGTPKDVSNIVEFLLSNKADFITGQIITVDGGFSL